MVIRRTALRQCLPFYVIGIGKITKLQQNMLRKWVGMAPLTEKRPKLDTKIANKEYDANKRNRKIQKGWQQEFPWLLAMRFAALYASLLPPVFHTL